MMELSRCDFEVLRKDQDFNLYRARESARSPVLVLAPAAEFATPESLKQLEHYCSLGKELDPAWAVRPIAVARHWDRTVLVLEDPGGVPLAQLLGQPLDLAFSLCLAISLSSALGRLHQRNIIHKDIKPHNVLVNADTGQCWLSGFNIASRHRRERQTPESVAGTVAYMAPEQTGRMNRSIDSRSDLYALGVTLYEMLTGSLPFTASAPLEWVHCHIARMPVPPGERSKGVPAPVSAIVMKLLAKTAEDRYQTAAGLESDLRRCLVEWERGSPCQIREFPLGKQDIPDRLLIPEKLYGRVREIDSLLASFGRVVHTGRLELMLVSGYSGVGKSSVVNELHKVLIPPRGLFASGKFDRYKRDIPYSTLAQAFQSLIRPLLKKSEAELQIWRDALRDALDPNGQLMVNLIPELKFIIGEQPPVTELAPQDAQLRFHLVFRRFIGVFARPEHPLALFLDDLQWLDTATLDFLEYLFTADSSDQQGWETLKPKLRRASQPNVGHFLLIGAYRANEVDAGHALWRRLEIIRQSGAAVHEIVLAPLAREDLVQMLADSLHCEPERAIPLGQLVHERTGGNPLFVIQFIYALGEEGLLAFDRNRARWRWDLNRIHAKGCTDNVVELMIGKLNRLPTRTLEALRQLACLGNEAGSMTLSMVLARPEAELQDDIREAVRQELVVRLESQYRFAHDRVQEAAYALTPGQARATAHLRIGRALLVSTPPEKREEAIFEIVNQLNRGAVLITSRDEQEELAQLNLTAAKRAKASTAYASALKYLIAGADLLGDDCWERRHDLAFSLEINRAECEFLTGELENAQKRLTMLSTRAADIVEQAGVACLSVDLYTRLDQSDRAVSVCLDYLRRLGIEWSSNPVKEEAQSEYERIWSQLGSRTIEELAELSVMTDPAALATMDVLTKVLLAAWFTNTNLLALAICRAVNLSLECGNSAGSCVPYVWLGMIAGPHFGDYEAGFRFGRLGYHLVERRAPSNFQPRIYMHFGGFVMPWTKHFTAGRDLLRRAVEAGKKNSDLTYAAASLAYLNAELLASGDRLAEVQNEAEGALESAQEARFGFAIEVIIAQLGLIRTLRGVTPKFGVFDDGQFDELRFEQHFSSNPALALSEGIYWIRKLQGRFFAGDYPAAVAAAARAELLLRLTLLSPITVADYHFYGALARAAVSDSVAPDDQRENGPTLSLQAEHLKTLAGHHEQLALWARNCPENFENRSALVAAEIARIEGHDLSAMRLYERAIRSARENGFVQNEALANELAGRFYLARGIETTGNAHLRNARACYVLWGADGKVRQLEHLYPFLTGDSQPTLGTIGTAFQQLDVSTMVKASQAVSSEIMLPRLIETLMGIALQSAGADRGLLILPRENSYWIEADARALRDHIEVALCQVSITSATCPETLLRYVIRTQKSVIIDDASKPHLFSGDEYLQREPPRSILCVPLVKGATLAGLLYLENARTSHAFTPDRIAMLELLASQAAISLENTRLYRDLQNREAKLRRLVEADIVGIFIANFEGQIVEANEAFLNMVNYNREDLVSGRLSWKDLTPPEWHDLTERAVAQLKALGSIQPYEKEYFRKDGSRVPVLIGSAIFEEGQNEGVSFVLDLTERKRGEEALRRSEAHLARERERFARQRATELAKANEALRQFLDALAAAPVLDRFLGQVTAVITGQLGAASSTLQLRNFERNELNIEFVFQDGRVMSPAEARYPGSLLSTSLGDSQPQQAIAVYRVTDFQSPISDDHRRYLLQLGVKTLLMIPLVSVNRVIGLLGFRFITEREFHPEDLEIAKALATQASLAIELTRLAETARQSAVLKERNRLAGEIHDALAQYFAVISLQLVEARKTIKNKHTNWFEYVERAHELARFGLAEARISVLSLEPRIEKLGLLDALRVLVERSNIPGRLRCTFRSNLKSDESLPPAVRQDVLRIAQEAVNNALRHANSTTISVSLQSDPPNLILKVKDNGAGMVDPGAIGEGFGLANMRERAKRLNGSLQVRAAPGRGTAIIVSLPVLPVDVGTLRKG